MDKCKKTILIIWHVCSFIILAIGLYLHFSNQTTTGYVGGRKGGDSGIYTYNGMQIIILALIFYFIGLFMILTDKRKQKDR